jgi:hypothetical protein
MRGSKKRCIVLNIFLILFVLFSVLKVSAFSDAHCTGGGNLATTCYVNNVYTFTHGETISANNLVIQTGGQIINTGFTSNMGRTINLNHTGNLTVENGGLIRGGRINIDADNVDVQSGATISTIGLGFAAGQGSGYLSTTSGATHGGRGGGNTRNLYGDPYFVSKKLGFY